jgi:HD-GYP domain-containing protein (c-di-GMP phosphodiesterase class II)
MSAPEQVLDFLEFVEGQPRQTVRQLLDKVLLKSRLLTGAEAGTVFIMRSQGGGRWLEPASLQNDRLRVVARNFVVPVSGDSIAGYVASTGQVVRVDDVYALPPDAPYRFNPGNERSGYRTVSMMCFALKNYQDEVIGVVQLINRRNGGPAPVPFDAEQAQLVSPIAQVLATHVERADMLERIRDRNAKLRLRNRELAEQRSQVVALQAETEAAFMLSINLLAHAAEIHDEETGNHIVRVNEYSYFLASELGEPAEFCDELRYSAQLHDVGKMSVDSAVLKKRGGLTPEEREEMNRHPVYGHRILERSPRLRMAADIALNHHEKWDGTGYPRQVAGPDIPLAARIVALADVYDALRSERPYKPAFSHAKAVEIITRGDERIRPEEHFDPALRQLFAARHDGMDAIWVRLKD